PGGMPGTLYLGEHEGLTGLLQDSAAKGKRVAASCAAPSVLGGLGLLKGKREVCYPGFEDQLKGAQVEMEEAGTDVCTTNSRGLRTASPFAMELISLLFGPEKAEEIKKSVIYMA